MRKLILVCVAALSFAGCATQRQAEGTAAGAIGGALIAGPVGAVVGGAAGAVIAGPGGALDRRCRYRSRYGSWRWRRC